MIAPGAHFQHNPPGSAWRFVGGVPKTIYGGNVDAARIYITSGDAAFWKPSRWVYHDHNTRRLGMLSRNELAANAAEGIRLCKSGITSGTRCGDILHTFADRTAIQRLLAFRACGLEGDSGAPVYVRDSQQHPDNPGITVPLGRAFGMHHGSSSLATTCPSGETSYAAHVQFFQDALDVTVWIN